MLDHGFIVMAVICFNLSLLMYHAGYIIIDIRYWRHFYLKPTSKMSILTVFLSLTHFYYC